MASGRTISGRTWLWLLPAIFYAVFWYWYTDPRGPLQPAEIDAFMARLEGGDPLRRERLRQFMEEDTGRQFIMVNLLDLQETPPVVPGAPPDASADELMGLYMQYMYRELVRRACHPVLFGDTVAAALDLVAAPGMERWDRVGLVRYRSRRDMLEIALNPAFEARHDYKIASLAKTIAVPIEPGLYLSDPRVLLALILLVLVLLVDRRFAGR